MPGSGYASLGLADLGVEQGPVGGELGRKEVGPSLAVRLGDAFEEEATLGLSDAKGSKRAIVLVEEDGAELAEGGARDVSDEASADKVEEHQHEDGAAVLPH